MRAVSVNEAEHRWVSFYFRPIKILPVFTAYVEFVSGWQHAWNYNIDTLGGLDLDGSTDKNLQYFVVKNLATLCTLYSK